ncbi:DUF3793 family protein [Faecalicatena contorta]|uniref:DUF3793 family protein n=1 Tax=Faecalicatena contorta TaxID=39482 RepID=A0A315ZZR4_9FIRM|nr:DUF3793 family protein [Faecalicatena contorta]PWJ50995.1 uncharacterized protein DUF3793 [Faecalicatena contorta]SUQ13563.1 Protein of unknown function [Faecalicatena contorta]
MPLEVLSYFLKHRDIGLKLRFQIVFQCAPFLKGLKVSCGITMEKILFCELEHIFLGTPVMYRKLSEAGDRCFVLLYREEGLLEYLKTIGVRSFIQGYGYESMGLDEMLDRLSLRISSFELRRMGFPHEIGVFLGYPVEDVRGFIKKEGKEYLLLGYWKVYDNPMAAKMIFRKYDQAKVCAVNEFLTGKSIREIYH